MNFTLIFLFAALDAVTFGPGNRFHLEYSKDDFGVRSHGIIETLSSNRTKFYPLPQSSAEEFIRLRPKDLPFGFTTLDHYEREEVIGPYQIDGGRIWFGNNYYDSEGMLGVGAFGYFDTASRKYTLFSPPEIARYEISAILVEPANVWLGLDQFVEDISTVPGGLVRWNRKTHQVHKYSLEFNVISIRGQDDSLRLKTRDGYALFRAGKVRRFLADGRPIEKFPPPPSHN